jgi:energy-coupling factor transport system permease protein
MRAPLAYAPRPGPLSQAGALAAAAYLGSLALVAFVFESPLVLAGAGGAVVVAGLAAHAGDALRTAARWALALGVIVVAVNGLASQRGDTVLVHGIWMPWETLDVTLEALVEGAAIALRIAVVMMAFAVYSATVDPDKVMRGLRPVARHSALTAGVIARLVPLASLDYARLSEAVALRGPAAAPAGRGALVRRLVAGSLDRAIDVAATLELRGYAHGAPRTAAPSLRSRHDAAFLATGLAIGVAAVTAQVAGAGGFDAYPTLSADAGPGALALALSLPLAAALPFARGRT